MRVAITLIGNEGFEIKADGICIYIDAFYTPLLSVGSAPVRTADTVLSADVILATHDHPDHFNSDQLVDLAIRTGARIVGNERVIGRISRRLPAAQLVTLHPPLLQDRSRGVGSAEYTLPAGRITAFRTFHGAAHNSYLIEINGMRMFHDGDNEDTRPLLNAGLGSLDALFMAPWHGSGWAEFIDAIKPRHWFLMHLTDEELDQQARGEFLTDLCDHVPPGLIALRPGESFAIQKEHC